MPHLCASSPRVKWPINKFAVEGRFAAARRTRKGGCKGIQLIQRIEPKVDWRIYRPGAWNIQFSEWKSTLAECLIATRDQEWPLLASHRRCIFPAAAQTTLPPPLSASTFHRLRVISLFPFVSPSLSLSLSLSLCVSDSPRSLLLFHTVTVSFSRGHARPFASQSLRGGIN